jgi:hypothetical protein
MSRDNSALEMLNRKNYSALSSRSPAAAAGGQQMAD